MRLLIPVILILGAIITTNVASAGNAARETADSIDALTVQLFLHEAESEYAEGNYSEALTRFSWLAQRGNPEARLALGIMYEEGQGVLHDYEEAFNLYQQAAKQGFASAQLRLARMYYFGRHVPPDPFLAYVWSSVAASQGDEIALRNRAKIARLINDHQVVSGQTLADQWIEKFNNP